MSHNFPTISFRISDYERREIEARIHASGMRKKDYFIRSCIYNRVCVVGKRETILPLLDELRAMHKDVISLGEAYDTEGEVTLTEEELEEKAVDYLYLLKAIIWLLEGAQYLWQEIDVGATSERR